MPDVLKSLFALAIAALLSFAGGFAVRDMLLPHVHVDCQVTGKAAVDFDCAMVDVR